MIDDELAVGYLVDGARDALAVLRAEPQDAQDEHVERALKQHEAFVPPGHGFDGAIAVSVETAKRRKCP